MKYVSSIHIVGSLQFLEALLFGIASKNKLRKLDNINHFKTTVKRCIISMKGTCVNSNKNFNLDDFEYYENRLFFGFN